ncbi:phospholipase C type enzyme [Scheffersomyces xylosifermentans]|uniref:phospholipase C type enzyme n=1 Tax=Scheffersomyces xylosifermentans TaxID=1304137 RepID=UPI00315DB3DE
MEPIDASAKAQNGKLPSSENTVKLLTLNTWGLKWVSKYRRQRLVAIADKLAFPNSPDDEYDIVALQEVWCEGDWNYINETCKDLYPYRRVFKSGIVAGPGLAILSKIAIDESFLYRFPINGRPSAFFRGDWLVGKSIAITLLKPHHPNAIPIAILNSHMHAPYAQSGENSYSTHRACQAWDFAKIVKMLKKSGYAVIQVGDLNSKPGSLPYKLFTVEGGLSDSWDGCHDNTILSTEEIAKMQPIEQITKAGITCDSQLNTWRAHREIWEACRLDYALIDSSNIKPINASVKFTEKLSPPFNCSYSDHFAYSTELVVRSKDQQAEPAESVSTSEKIEVYRELSREIAEYRKDNVKFQATWRKYHFFLSIIVVIALHFAITFVSEQQAWLSVVIMVTNSLVGITGVVNGLIWYCGIRSESRALQEVQMEVDDALTSLQGYRDSFS